MAKVATTVSDNKSLGAVLRSTYDDGMFESDVGLGVFKTGFPTLDYGLGFPVDIYEKNEWKRREIHKGILMGSYMMIVGDSGTGKALPIDTVIPTPDGMRKFGDLKVGDSVLGKDGWPTKITHIFEKGVLPTYEIFLDDDRTTLASGDHLWTVYEHGTTREEKTLTTEELAAGLKENKVYYLPINGAVRMLGQNNNPSVDSWLAGILLSSGNKSVADVEKEFDIHVNLDDGMAISLFRDVLCAKPGTIPDMYKFGTVYQRMQFLAGVCETYGEVGPPPSYKVSIHLPFKDDKEHAVRRSFAREVAFIARSIGYRVEVDLKLPERIGNHEYTPMPLEGTVDIKIDMPHREKFMYFKRGVRKAIVSNLVNNEEIEGNLILGPEIKAIVREQKDLSCRCIKVEAEDGLFLTNDFIVTHNTTLAVQMASNIIRNYEHGLVYHYDLERASINSHVMALSRLPRRDFDVSNPNYRYILNQNPADHEMIQQQILRVYREKILNQDKYLIKLDQYDEYGAPITTMQPTVVIIDSIPMIGNIFELGNSKDEKKMEQALTQMDAAQSAGAFKRMLKMILGPMKKANIILIGISHLGVKIQSNPMIHNKKDFRGMGADEIIAGGKMNTYGATNIIKTDRRSGKGYTVENGDGFNGFDSMITVVKSRTTFDAKLIPMIYDCDNGFDSLRSLIQYGLDKGIITGNRASMKFTADPECKFSYVRLYEDLKSKPEILQNLTKFVVPDLEKPFAVDHAPDQFMQVFMEY